MKKIIRVLLLSFMLCTCSVALIAQQPTFTKVFGDHFNPVQGCGIVKTFDSNYMVVGSISRQALILKMDQGGNILWDKKISFPGYFSAWLTRIIRTHDSCFAVVGNLNDNDIVCMKITADGDTLWSRSINFGNDDYANSIFETYDKGVLIAGTSYLNNVPPYSKMAIVKLDSVGNQEWSSLLTIGTNANEAASVRQTFDSGCILIGTTQNSEFKGATTLVKLNSTGTGAWSKRIEYPFSSSAGLDVIATDSTLFCNTDVPGIGTALIKTDFSGNILWSKYGFGGGNGFSYRGILRPRFQCTADNGFAFVSVGAEGSLVKLEPTGNLKWTKSLRLDVMDMTESYDHGFMVIGNGPLIGVKLVGPLGYQLGIVKSDSQGNGVGCIEDGSDFSDTCVLVSIPISVITSMAAGNVIAIHPFISDPSLSSFDGCIDVTGGVDDCLTQQDGLVVFPSPVRNTFQIKIINRDKLTFKSLTINNIIGEKVFQSSCPQLLKSEIDLCQQPDGLYMIQVVFNEKTYSQKFLIRH